MELAQRFWDRVDKSGECWYWKLSCRPTGYGQIKVGGKNKASHRVAWELTFGSIPGGLDVLHTCDKPPCVRPDHLYLGNDIDNVRDKHVRGRSNYQTRQASMAARRLTLGQVQEIREAIKYIPMSRLGRPKTGSQPPASLRGLARKYGVVHSTIRAIKNNKTWREI